MLSSGGRRCSGSALRVIPTFGTEFREGYILTKILTHFVFLLIHMNMCLPCACEKHN